MCAHARQQNQRKRKVRRMRYRVSERARLRRHVQSVRRTGFDHLFNGKGNPMRDGGIKQKKCDSTEREIEKFENKSQRKKEKNESVFTAPTSSAYDEEYKSCQ